MESCVDRKREVEKDVPFEPEKRSQSPKEESGGYEIA